MLKNFSCMFLNILLGIFCSCIVVQCIHLTIILIRFSRPDSTRPENTEPVTIIVCAHDEEENLKVLLPMLFKQKYHSFEVIIVDDRSNDGSHEYLMAASAEYKKLRYLTVEHLPDHMNGKKYGLTLAIKAARYDQLVLTDADCRPASDLWLRDMAGGFGTDTAFVLGHSMYEKHDGLLNLFIRYETLWTAIHFLSAAMGRRPYMATGRNLAYRKSVFLANKGFRGFGQLVGGDDDLLVNRYAHGATTEVVLTDESFTFSIPKKTWREFFIQKRRHLSVGKHYKPASRFLLGVMSLSHIFGLLLTIVVAIVPGGWLFAMAGYVTRTLLLHITLSKTGRKLKADIPVAWITFLDWMFVGYYTFTGLSATFTKRIRWK